LIGIYYFLLSFFSVLSIFIILLFGSYKFFTYVCKVKKSARGLTLKKRKMKRFQKSISKGLLALVLVSSAALVSAQGSFNVGTDVVSSYVWRGFKQGDRSPNIQPYVSYTLGGFTVGSWGSASTTGIVNEIDLYATYAISSSLALTVTDYNWTFTSPNQYFKYGTGTDHIFEATLAYTGPESLPLSASVNTMFAGADKTVSGDQAYSTYAELGYQLTSNAKVFVGGLLTDVPTGGYLCGSGVTNVGFKVTKSIQLSDKFTLPVYGIAGFNPKADDAFLVVGITL
jgi:hypothetical protein